MIKQKLDYLFYRIHKTSLTNFGQDAGFAAMNAISILFAFNILSLIGFINKIFLHNPKLSREIFVISFLAAYIICYFLFLYKAKYKQMILHYDAKPLNNIVGALGVIGYIFISFLLFVIVALIRV